MTSIKRNEIVRYLDERLSITTIEDQSVNGLQVQGADRVSRIALATDAAMAVYERAAETGCEMVLVHHGLIWGGIRTVTDRVYTHLKYLIENRLNLYAAHLPLDAHPEVGNNAELARIVGLKDRVPFGAYHGTALGFSGTLEQPTRAQDLASLWQRELGGTPLVLPFGPEAIQ